MVFWARPGLSFFASLRLGPMPSTDGSLTDWIAVLEPDLTLVSDGTYCHSPREWNNTNLQNAPDFQDGNASVSWEINDIIIGAEANNESRQYCW